MAKIRIPIASDVLQGPVAVARLGKVLSRLNVEENFGEHVSHSVSQGGPSIYVDFVVLRSTWTWAFDISLCT